MPAARVPLQKSALQRRAIRCTPAAWADYTYWQGQYKKTLKALVRINTLIEAARRKPFSGIGKPEPLLGNLSGYWSRRIDEAHRLVVAVDDADFDVIACRGTMTTSGG